MNAPDSSDALRDRCSLERELGRSGMATVYLGRDLKHERPVVFCSGLRPGAGRRWQTGDHRIRIGGHSARS